MSPSAIGSFQTGRGLTTGEFRKQYDKTTTKVVNIIHITHRDEVESPFVDWLREAYDLPDKLTTRRSKPSKRRKPKAKRKPLGR